MTKGDTQSQLTHTVVLNATFSNSRSLHENVNSSDTANSEHIYTMNEKSFHSCAHVEKY